MCYHTATLDEVNLRAFLTAYGYEVYPYQMYYHADGFNMPMLPVTTTEAPKKVQPGMWKLIPHWIKTMDEAIKYANTLNAKCEEIFEKASYKSYIGKYRALLWVGGFFEANHPTKNETIPYYIYNCNREPISIGCVYNNWINQDTGELITTFSIITTPANELMAGIHNDKKRMPLIIQPADRDKWLGKLTKEEINNMMKPLPDGILAAHKVSNLVFKKRVDTNVPEVLEIVL